MLKFVIALAEMFSAFSAKLHDMSEDMPNPVILTSDDVIDIVKEAIRDGDITAPTDESEISADDISGLDRYVDNQIDSYDYEGILDRRLFEEQTMTLINSYLFENRMDCANVSWDKECEAMRDYMHGRWLIWHEERKVREERKKAQIIKDYLKSQECPESPHRLTIIPHGKPDVQI
jgi:hypothetical protein